jgi:hypothetical protein
VNCAGKYLNWIFLVLVFPSWINCPVKSEHWVGRLLSYVMLGAGHHHTYVSMVPVALAPNSNGPEVCICLWKTITIESSSQAFLPITLASLKSTKRLQNLVIICMGKCHRSTYICIIPNDTISPRLVTLVIAISYPNLKHVFETLAYIIWRTVYYLIKSSVWNCVLRNQVLSLVLSIT